MTWVTAVEETYRTARAWCAAHALAPPEAREAQYVTLTSTTHRLGLQYARDTGHGCQALAKRLLRHEDELFQFVLVAGLDADNNRAERAIRPVVMVRKLSGGSRSAHGTRTRMTLLSAFLTWQARNANPFTACLAVLSGQHG